MVSAVWRGRPGYAPGGARSELGDERPADGDDGRFTAFVPCLYDALGERSRMIRLALVLSLIGFGCHVGYDPVDGATGPAESGVGPGDAGSPRVDASAGALCDPTDSCKRVRNGHCVTIDPPVGCTTMTCANTCFALCLFPLAWDGARTNCETAPGWSLAEIDNGFENQCVNMMNAPHQSWIGLHQASGATGLSDGWSWSTGNTPMFENWVALVDQDGVENGQWQCGYIDGNGQWRDNGCGANMNSVCRLP